MQKEKLIFSEILESRGPYFVEYRPPHHGYRFASLNLTFTAEYEIGEVVKALEEEAKFWLKKYTVPVMASAFDEEGSFIDVTDLRPESHLICFYSGEKDEIEEHWKLLKDDEIPDVALNQDYLLDVYDEFNRRGASEIRAESEMYARKIRYGMRIIFFWVVMVPAIVAIIEFFIPQWLAIIVLFYSLSMAVRKGLKIKGKIKKSKSEILSEESERRMRHHDYHCEKNPVGFQRLKLENFQQKARENVEKRAELAKHVSNKKIEN